MSKITADAEKVERIFRYTTDLLSQLYDLPKEVLEVIDKATAIKLKASGARFRILCVSEGKVHRFTLESNKEPLK